MIADSGWCFGLPSVLSRPVNSLSKFADRYRRIPDTQAFVTAATGSFVLATVSGILGGIAAMYLYDRANSKGDDLAVGLGGLFAIGTFTFVIVFTWLQKVHHSVSSRTPLFALYACLALPVVVTLLSAGDIDDHYLLLVVGDWLAILFFGLLSLFVCRRWWHDSD
jgi:purine-cytosine permease-like protein